MSLNVRCFTLAVRRWRSPTPVSSPRRIRFSSICLSEVSPREYAERRRRFLDCLPSNSLMLLPAADESLYSHDVLWPSKTHSLWYHLFGAPASMRHQLSPPSSVSTNDVRMAMAVFAKEREGGATHTLLFVPPVTTDPATLVWGSEAWSVAPYTLLLSLSEESAASRSKNHCNVMTNEVNTICCEVRSLLGQMVQRGATEWTEEALLAAVQRKDREVLLRLMPTVLADYPQQMRWDGRRYRLECRHAPELPCGGGRVSQPVFHHPLEALFSCLQASPLAVPRPCFSTAPASVGGGVPTDLSIEFRYAITPGYTPGLVRDSVAEAVLHPKTGEGVSIGVTLPIRSAAGYLWLYRQLKCPSQIRQHLRSARATEDAFRDVMRAAATTLSEHSLYCTFQRAVCDISAHAGAGAQVRSAYIPVVASGVRGTEIHYTDNNGVAESGEVVRVDAGVEVENVPTDCTRTFPMGGCRFDPHQAVLYDGLLHIQRMLLRCLRPGVPVGEVAARHIMETRQLLCAIGVDVRRTAVSTLTTSAFESAPTVSADLEQQLPLALVRSCFCAHLFGHFFGLDLHEELGRSSRVRQDKFEAGEKARGASLCAPRVLQGGMMHTVEPGIYMPSLTRAALFGLDAAHIPEVFHRGVGMQIEDDALILPTDEGRDTATGTSGCEEQPPWSRGEYLQHAVAAFHRHCGGAHCDAHGASLLVTICDDHIALICTGMYCIAIRSAVRFLFSQRVALEGLSMAKAALKVDMKIIERLKFVSNPADPDGPEVPDAAASHWYPYTVVVTTATIPKDIELIEALMRR